MMSPYADPGLGSAEHYPAWSADRQMMSTEEFEDNFLDLTQKFGLQRGSMWFHAFPPISELFFKKRNNLTLQLDFTMHLLNSRASRMSPNHALITLHADYIGGQHASYASGILQLSSTSMMLAVNHRVLVFNVSRPSRAAESRQAQSHLAAH
jgi:1,3-beta-glucan synthase